MRLNHYRGDRITQQICAQGVDDKANMLIEDKSVLIVDAFVSLVRSRLTYDDSHEGLKIKYAVHQGGLIFFKLSALDDKRTVTVSCLSDRGVIAAWFGRSTLPHAADKFCDKTTDEVLEKLASGQWFDAPVLTAVGYGDLQDLAKALIDYLA